MQINSVLRQYVSNQVLH